MPHSQPLTIKQALSKAKKAAKRGKIESALELYNAVLAHQPNHPVAAKAVRNLQKQSAGRQAGRAYAANPPQDQIDTLIALYHSGDMLKTEEACRGLLSTYPNSLLVINLLGAALKGQGRLQEALAQFDAAITNNPDYVDAHSNRGVTLQELGRLEEAVASFDKAIELKPDYAEANSNRGLVMQELGRLDEAIASHRRALAINLDYAAAHSNLGNALLLKGQTGEAFEHHRKAVALAPQVDSYWTSLAMSLPGLSFAAVTDDLIRELSILLTHPSVEPSAIARPIQSALWQLPDFAETMDAVISRASDPDTSFEGSAERLLRTSGIELFLKLMRLSPIFDLRIESALTVLRRVMLQRAVSGASHNKELPFATALALQCFTNEYVFPETEEESATVDSLERQIAEMVAEGQPVPESSIAALGSYRPLHRMSWAETLSARDWENDIGEVIRRQISEPLSELAIHAQIPRLTKVENTVSQSVREQYEENPYPRWINAGFSGRDKSIENVLLATLPHLDRSQYSFPEAPQILVAGCGTGRHVLRTAMRYSNATVLAVDLSLSSIAYAIRKTRELGITNVEYAQADIMELGTLQRQFDLIESVGVLHHLEDPAAGWRILIDLLRPGGLMKIGLYSELAREDVVACRKLISDKEYSASTEDIRRCRQDIVSLSAEGNDVLSRIFSKNDFFSMSECRDLLFHVQEHRFTLPQLEEALTELELEFLGFEMREQSALTAFRKHNPQDTDLTSLQLWHQFELENPDTFSNMYQFWCRKGR